MENNFRLDDVLKKHLFYSGIILFIAICLIFIFPKKRIENNETLYNPNKCNYYISLQSILANYPLLSNDKANVQLIKKRLLSFEKEVAVSPSITAKQYQANYFSKLHDLQASSISSIMNTEEIINISKQVYPVVDDFYLNNTLFCVNPLYDWSVYTHRRILRHNLSGLYINLPTKYSTVLSAVADDWLTGQAPGLLTINQSTVLYTQYMTGIPLLTSLYALPKFDFVKIGRPDSAAPWNYFSANSFIDPISRKILNISGVDVFTVSNKDPQINNMVNVQLLSSPIHHVFDQGFVTFTNQDSYGLAYLAKNIFYEDKKYVKENENIIKQFFLKHENHFQFNYAVDSLYQKLMQLKDKYDVILEVSPVRISQKSVINPVGQVRVGGFIAEKASFITSCPKEGCTLVFNIAHAKGWNAYVNGGKAKIKRANFAFMAVDVPTGTSYVWFIYEPFLRVLADFVSLITLIAILFWVGRPNAWMRKV